jgi:hypothetical protein
MDKYLKQPAPQDKAETSAVATASKIAKSSYVENESQESKGKTVKKWA